MPARPGVEQRDGEPPRTPGADGALTREIRALLAGRVAAEGPVSEAAHAGLVVVVAAVQAAFVPWRDLVPWVLTVFAAVGVRFWLRRRAAARGSDPDEVLRAV